MPVTAPAFGREGGNPRDRLKAHPVGGLGDAEGALSQPFDGQPRSLVTLTYTFTFWVTSSRDAVDLREADIEGKSDAREEAASRQRIARGSFRVMKAPSFVFVEDPGRADPDHVPELERALRGPSAR